MPKSYDRSYFDRWYRDPRKRVKVEDDVMRKVRLVVGIAEYYLERPLRSVLDVGCGEGAWRPLLKRIRPSLRYQGVDASEYAVQRFGRRRNIRLGTVGGLRDLKLKGPYDLVVCCDVMHYVPSDELARGVREMGRLAGGLAYLEAFTTEDAVVGDKDSWQNRTPAWYRRLFASNGFSPVGSQCYVTPGVLEMVSALEGAT